MNYNPNQNPKYVTECILEYIEEVMEYECETGKDSWNIQNIFSGSRCGYNICKKCQCNKDKLSCMVNEFKDQYDSLMILNDYVGKHRVFMPKLNRDTTPYKDVYYNIRNKIVQLGQYDLYSNCCGAENCIYINNKDKSWDDNSEFALGELLFAGDFEPNCDTCKQNWAIINLKIDNMVLDSNIKLLELQISHKFEILVEERFKKIISKLQRTDISFSDIY